MAKLMTWMELAGASGGRYRVRDKRSDGGTLGPLYRGESRPFGLLVGLRALTAPPAPALYDRLGRLAVDHERLAPPFVKVLDFGEHERQPWIAVEWAEGRSAETEVDQRGPFAPTRVIALGATVAAALAEAHREDLSHQDLKPACLLLGDGDALRILDAGVLAAVAGDRAGFLTTPNTRAPEQLMTGSGLDPRTDIFALGAILFRLTTGRAIRAHWVAQRLVSGAPETLFPEGAPGALVDVIRRAMALRPRDRYQSMVELRDALAQLR